MKQEEKELLLRDLCGRLPYGVKVHTSLKPICTIFSKPTLYSTVVIDGAGENVCNISDIKPYLFPMSSMNVEQICKVKNLLPNNRDISFKNQKISFYGDGGNVQLDQLEKVFNLFNMWHIDYRGLIPMGLAKDCTNLNIY